MKIKSYVHDTISRSGVKSPRFTTLVVPPIFIGVLIVAIFIIPAIVPTIFWGTLMVLQEKEGTILPTLPALFVHWAFVLRVCVDLLAL